MIVILSGPFGVRELHLLQWKPTFFSVCDVSPGIFGNILIVYITVPSQYLIVGKCVFLQRNTFQCTLFCPNRMFFFLNVYLTHVWLYPGQFPLILPDRLHSPPYLWLPGESDMFLYLQDFRLVLSLVLAIFFNIMLYNIMFFCKSISNPIHF